MTPFAKEAQAVADLTAHLAGDAELRGVSVREVFKVAPGRAVFLIRWQGGRAVLKWHRRADAAEIVLRQQRELEFLGAALGAGPNRVMACLRARPDLGLVILSHAPGARVDDAIVAAGPARRARLVARAGAWLAAVSALRQTIGAFAPDYWVRTLAGRDLSGLGPGDRAVFGQLVEELDWRGQALRRFPVLRAAGHGDFAGLNLILREAEMTGIDMQGETWGPVAREAARFLVWQQMREPGRGPLRHGVDAADLAAFLSSGAVPEAEADTTLPFLIGEELGRRFLDPGIDRDRLRAAIADWLDQPASMSRTIGITRVP